MCNGDTFFGFLPLNPKPFTHRMPKSLYIFSQHRSNHGWDFVFEHQLCIIALIGELLPNHDFLNVSVLKKICELTFCVSMICSSSKCKKHFARKVNVFNSNFLIFVPVHSVGMEMTAAYFQTSAYNFSVSYCWKMFIFTTNNIQDSYLSKIYFWRKFNSQFFCNFWVLKKCVLLILANYKNKLYK